jgi:DNA-binding GntR family transcriptional regulator
MPVEGEAVQEAQSVASVFEMLHDAIITCELPPGTVSSQVALARRFDVGRTPLREALRLLQSEGLVAGEPNRRVRVADISPADLEDLYMLRILLETTAMRLTFPTLTSADIAEMRGFMAQMDHYGSDRDWGGLRAPHKAFHMRFIANGGERVVKLIGSLFDQGERYRQVHIAVTTEQWAERQEEHRALIDAAVERDADLAVRLLTDHYVRTAELVMSSLAPGRTLDRLHATVEGAAS